MHNSEMFYDVRRFGTRCWQGTSAFSSGAIFFLLRAEQPSLFSFDTGAYCRTLRKARKSLISKAELGICSRVNGRAAIADGGLTERTERGAKRSQICGIGIRTGVLPNELPLGSFFQGAFERGRYLIA